MRVEFKVNSRPQEFANWLRLYIEELFEANALVMSIGPDLTIMFSAADIETLDALSGQLRVSIRGMVHKSSGDDDDFVLRELIGPPDNVLVAFTLTTLSSERSEVKATAIEEALPFFRALLVYIGERYDEATESIHRQLEAWQPGLPAWVFYKQVPLPWQIIMPLSLEDVRAACYEHLARFPSKRFPPEWEVEVTEYKEQEGIALYYDIRSRRRAAGQLRLRRIRAQETRLEVKLDTYTDEAGEARLREIVSIFAGRWLEDLQNVAASQRTVHAPMHSMRDSARYSDRRSSVESNDELRKNVSGENRQPDEDGSGKLQEGGYVPDGYLPDAPSQKDRAQAARRVGRPRNSDDTWAYEQVRKLGRQPNDVYPEWLYRIGPRAKTLADPRDSFSKAIRQRNRE